MVQTEASRVVEEEGAGRKDTSPERGQDCLSGLPKGAVGNLGVPESPGASAGAGKEDARGTGWALGQGREGIQDRAACWACRSWCTGGCKWNSVALRGHRGRGGAQRAQGTEEEANAGEQGDSSEGEGALVDIHVQYERTSETQPKDEDHNTLRRQI